MTKEIQKSTGIEIIPKELNKKQALKIAKIISSVEGDVRLAKGKLWNACERGTRNEVCDLYGWAYGSMKLYGLFSSEQGEDSHQISYPLWETSRKAGVSKEDRPNLLEKAAKKGWSPKELKDHIKPPEKTKAQIAGEKGDARFSKALADGKFDNDEDEDEEIFTPDTMDIEEAFLVFGIDVDLQSISKETFNVLYRHYAKKYHPDTGGDPELMAKLTEAKAVLKEEIENV